MMSLNPFVVVLFLSSIFEVENVLGGTHSGHIRSQLNDGGLGGHNIQGINDYINGSVPGNNQESLKQVLLQAKVSQDENRVSDFYFQNAMMTLEDAIRLLTSVVANESHVETFEGGMMERFDSMFNTKGASRSEEIHARESSKDRAIEGITGDGN